VPLTGLPLGIAVLAVFAIWPAQFSAPGVALLLAVGGVGMGTMYPTTTVLIQNAVPPYQVGTATGTLNFFRQLGGAIVVAVFGAIVLSGLDLRAGGAAALERLSAGGGSPEDFAMLFRFVFMAGAGFLAAAFVAVLCIAERPLRGPAAAPLPAAPNAPGAPAE
jgi:MFS family permease